MIHKHSHQKVQRWIDNNRMAVLNKVTNDGNPECLTDSGLESGRARWQNGDAKMFARWHNVDWSRPKSDDLI